MWEIFSIIATQFVIQKQLKDLTHMLCVWIWCHKLYKNGVFFYVLTLKYTPISRQVQKSLTLKTKHEIKFKNYMVII